MKQEADLIACAPVRWGISWKQAPAISTTLQNSRSVTNEIYGSQASGSRREFQLQYQLENESAISTIQQSSKGPMNRHTGKQHRFEDAQLWPGNHRAQCKEKVLWSREQPEEFTFLILWKVLKASCHKAISPPLPSLLVTFISWWTLVIGSVPCKVLSLYPIKVHGKVPIDFDRLGLLSMIGWLRSQSFHRVASAGKTL